MSRRSSAAGPDVAAEVRATLGVGVAAIKRQVEKQAKAKKPDVAELSRLMAALSPILGQLRRYDEAIAAGAGKLKPAEVIAYLRALPPEQRDAIVAEVVGDEDERAGGLLS